MEPGSLAGDRRRPARSSRSSDMIPPRTRETSLTIGVATRPGPQPDGPIASGTEQRSEPIRDSFGTGRSCSVITPGRSKTAARMESVPARVRAGPETGDAVMAHLARGCWFLDATGGPGEPHRQFAANRNGGLRTRQPRADAGPHSVRRQEQIRV